MASQLPPVAVNALLELRVREADGVAPVQKAHQRLELLTARAKANRRSTTAPRAPVTAPTLRRMIRITVPGRQDFIAPR